MPSVIPIRRRLKVLLIDDDKYIGFAFQATLGKYDIDIDQAEELDVAEHKIESYAYDAVILDLSLVGTMGLDTLKKARMFITLPILVLTGQEDDEQSSQAQKALQEGAVSWLEKPADAKTVARSIRLEIARWHLRAIQEELRNEASSS